MCKYGLVFTIFLLSLNGIQCQLVRTSVGDIQGVLDTENGYNKFLGIPYGAVSETNPFGDSAPFPEFSSTFVANNDSTVCPQIQDGEVVGVRDCLNLNIYVPVSATPTSRLPVIIWVHGGYFMLGNSTERLFGPQYLVRHGVIFVTVNYRVGPFGFMCLGIDSVPGNQGLKDQQLAFEWVERHIEAFGGNRSEITLAGNSAGAHSIDLHLISQRRNLYNKIIMQSGSSLVGTVLYEPDLQAAIKIAERLGIDPATSREAVSLLAQVDANSVIRAATELEIQFKPCVEPEIDGVDAFIAHSWITGETTQVKDIPVLIGFNEYERMNYHINQEPEYFQNLDIFTSRLNQTFDFDQLSEGDRLGRMEDYVRRFYLGDNATSEALVWPIINFDSDFVYIHPIQRSIKKYLAGEAGDIFYYMFTYSGGRNQHQDANNVSIARAAHNDDLAYLFDSSLLPEAVSPADQLVIDRMTTMWTNFAKFGDPTPQTTTLLPVKWTPLTNEIYHYLRIDSELSMERRPLNRRMAFFDLFYMYNGEYQRTFDEFECCEDEPGSATIHPACLITLLSALLVLAFFRQ